jgi:hypothetical protein
MRWVRHVAQMGIMRNAYSILVRKSEVKRPLRRPRCRWEDNVRMYLREIRWEGRTEFIWLRIRSLVGFSEHSNEP